ncbi:MAG: tRNA (adenosine(37)-N6)-dimethylallyltransferase MiaA [Verrucomicrobia bacterium]|nr:tRNA (adenosine(37)-N6)-dimethylallyltransferase MiaA [Verrucomicrobiota bacterium]
MSKIDQGSRRQAPVAFFLVGPTAVGKSATAHAIARKNPATDIVSADAMLVYGGMDIGTDKPSQSELQAYRYHGVNLADSSEEFSAGGYLEAVGPVLSETAGKRRIIVVGGTGLYVKCLLEGLGAETVDPAVRKEVEGIYEAAGVEGLKEALREADAARLARLSDVKNPRRLMRALELARSGVSLDSSWRDVPSGVLAGLRMDRTELNARIVHRVDRMYERGLIDEVRSLLETHGELSRTAAQAIGYKEAIDVIRGKLSAVQAVELTTIRTRKLAKRQMTWFRNQANVEWIDVTADMTAEDIAVRVEKVWEEHGPSRVQC